MKPIACAIFIFSLLGCTSPKRELGNTFYCFSNAGNLPGAPEGLDAKVNFFKELGFDGWGGHYGEEDYPARRAALDRAGMQLPEIYWNLDVDSAGNWSSKEGIREAIMDSKDRNLIVSLIVRAPAYQENQRAGDPLVVEAVRDLADFAAPYGVKVAVYPHVDVYCETSEHSVRLAKMAGRDNVGAIFNLCHFLKKEGEEAWEQELRKALPYLYMISLSGADAGNTREMGWDRLIQPLGEGSFDTYPLVKLAKDLGYEGPFGLQTYNIKQDAQAALSKSISTWREYQQRYSKEQAGVSAGPAGNKEVQAEFTDLFDGESSRGWRGINSHNFPEDGWQIRDGVLMVHASDGAESAGGGDILTKEKYGDFELRWEWKLLTKGGNSGVKYYVEEQKTDHLKQGIGLEYQILDDANHAWMLEGKMTPCDYHTLGSLYEIYPASCDKAPAPLGEWNSSRIVSRDGQVEHWLNGKLILGFNRFSEDFRQKVRESKFRSYSDFGQIREGYLLIQDHGSEVHYRNIKIKRY
jgi:sugar phosphate isomerase/epimerase